MTQRPQQLAKAFLNEYGEEYNLIYLYIPFLGIKPSIERIDGYNILQINSFSYLKRILKNNGIYTIDIIYYYYIFYNNFINNFKYYFKTNKIIYDYLDDISISDIDIEKDHINAILSADLVCTTADKLKDQILNYRKDVLYVPNGVSLNDWEIDNIDKFNDIKLKYNLHGNIIGFYGAIEDWIDFDILEEILKNNNYTLLIIGIDNKNLLKTKGLLQYKNLIFIGYKPYSELKYYSSLFDVSIIPFKINKLTDGVSPVKFFEYLVQGKPVITTGFYEILKHSDYCFISKGKYEFLDNIKIALEKTKSEEYIKNIKEYGKKYDWNSLIKFIN
ncbi:MAG: hypothetical protein PHG82_05190 [Candidatus Gracilibacteria bacterium]|nr:hypothetical protein [Candidatus Gracilibacteria bacterium]